MNSSSILVSDYSRPSVIETAKNSSYFGEQVQRQRQQQQTRHASKVAYKTILLGDSGVGKTSIFVRLTQNMFRDKLNPTITMDIGRKVVVYNSNNMHRTQNISAINTTDESIQRREVHLQLWDTPGQEIFRSLVRIYYRNVTGVLLVISLEHNDQRRLKDQLDNMNYWINEINQNVDLEGNIQFVLLGNKSDCLESTPDPKQPVLPN